MALDKDVLTLKDVAKFLHVHPITVYRMLKAGRLPGAFKMGRVWRFNRKQFERLTAGTTEVPT